MLRSITKAEKVFETGDKPILVYCDDLKFYVCKHNRGQSRCYSLFAEKLVHGLMNRLAIPIANHELIQVNPEHVPSRTDCQPGFYQNCPAFGTLYLEESVELNMFPIVEDLKRLNNPLDLATISALDIWLSNEDRHWNNFNLLVNPSKGGYDIVPIDHEKCFNSRSFEEGRNLYAISESDSVIVTSEYKSVVKTKLKTLKQAFDFTEELYIRIKSLEPRYDEIIANTPAEWNIPPSYTSALKTNLFDKGWLDETKTQFLTLLKTNLKLK